MNIAYLISILLSSTFISGLLYSAPITPLEKVVIPKNNWSSQRVLSVVVGQLIETFNTPVEYVDISAENQWGALKRGIIHFQIEVWEPSMKQAFDEHLAKGNIIDLGTHQAKVIEEWWYPKYVEDSCPELPNWQALNKCKPLFKQDLVSDKGVYFSGPWHYSDADIIRALGLNFTIEYLPDELTLSKQLLNAVEDKRPIILLNWSPNWTDSYIEGNFIKFPAHSELCENIPEWGVNKELAKDCGNRQGGWLKKVGALNLQEKFPCVYNLIKNINFTKKMVAYASSLAVVEKLSDKEAAIKWSKLYSKEIKKWIPASCK